MRRGMVMVDAELLKQIQRVKQRYETALMRKANVIAVGVGLPVREGEPAEEPGIIVSVTHKVQWEALDPEDRIPKCLEGIRVWVQAIGTVKAQL